MNMKKMVKSTWWILVICVCITMGVFGAIRLYNQAQELRVSTEPIEEEIANSERYGQISLKLLNIKPNKQIKVLVNGYVVGRMDNMQKQFSVKDASLIEIDGSSMETPFFVSVVGQSDNIKNEYIGQTVRVDRTIAPVANIQLR